MEDITDDKKEYDLNIEPHLNVVGEIKRSEINGDIPKTATYARLNPSKKFIQGFYKFKEIKFNDGTVNNILQYYGEAGPGWVNSDFNREDKLHSNIFYSKDYKKLKEIEFLKIID